MSDMMKIIFVMAKDFTHPASGGCAACKVRRYFFLLPSEMKASLLLKDAAASVD